MSPSCYAEYWYEQDPFRRVRLIGKLAAPGEKEDGESSALSSCSAKCKCGGDLSAPGPGSSELLQPHPGAAPEQGAAGLPKGNEDNERICDWPCYCTGWSSSGVLPKPSTDQARSAPRGPFFLKLGPDAVVTLRSQAANPQEARPLTLSGPSEIPLDEAAVDLSTLDVRCKPKAKPRSGRRPR